MQKQIIANWKMHKTIDETLRFITEIEAFANGGASKVMLAVPYTALWNAAKQAEGMLVEIGAQNIDFHVEGAFTGEISARMIKDAGAKFVILGHSERRKLFHETSEIVNLKVKAALSNELKAIVCIGETFEERASGIFEVTLKAQLLDSLSGVKPNQMESITLAYEPIWAIGTGLTANSQDIYTIHVLCRQIIAEHWGAHIAAKLPILYGGSVKVENARELQQVPEVDGLLVGGASLSVDSFSKIILSQQALNLS